jgi:hypothetical protein
MVRSSLVRNGRNRVGGWSALGFVALFMIGAVVSNVATTETDARPDAPCHASTSKHPRISTPNSPNCPANSRADAEPNDVRSGSAREAVEQRLPVEVGRRR